MNKETFLEELRRCLQILEDQEQEDILEEYAQHIDIKVQKGQSEEEAIRDFGSVKALAAEILEAYHVKPEYQSGKERSRLPELSREKLADGKRWFGKAGNYLKAKGGACIHGIGNGFRWMGAKWKAFVSWVQGLFSGKKVQNIPEEEKRSEEGMALEGLSLEMTGAQGEKSAAETSGGLGVKRSQEERMSGQGTWIGKAWKNFCQGVAVCWGACVRFCLWGLRLCWNLAWLLFSVFCGIFTVLVLACVGGLLVLQFQGYPLFGILLISLGGLLCFGALTCGSYSMMIRRKKETEEETAKASETEEEDAGTLAEIQESQEEVRHE